MNKNIKFIILLAVVIINTACSSDDKEDLDFSFLTNIEWNRTHYNLPIEVDLNLDGISSSNMVDEFACIGNERFILSNDKKVNYYNDNLLLFYNGLDINDPQYAEWYECEELFYPFWHGTFEMINENTVQLNIEANTAFGNSAFSIQFRYINNKLIRDYTQNHPTSYNEETMVFIREVIEIEEIFQ